MASDEGAGEETMTKTHVFHRYHIHDERPNNILRHVLVHLDRGMLALHRFEFATAQKELDSAKCLALVLYQELP